MAVKPTDFELLMITITVVNLRYRQRAQYVSPSTRNIAHFSLPGHSLACQVSMGFLGDLENICDDSALVLC